MIEQNAFTLLFGIFLFLTCRDMFFKSPTDMVAQPNHQAHNHLDHAASDHLAPSEATNQALDDMPGAPTVKIQYCHSCGYRQAFDAISDMLQTNFPKLKVEGEYHQPSWMKMQFINVLFISKIAILILIYSERDPFRYLNMETPRLWSMLLNSKISSTLIILLMSNTLESNMMSTGALEIFYNDIPVWSKLQTGRMPTAPELIQFIGSHYNLNEKNPQAGFVGVVAE